MRNKVVYLTIDDAPSRDMKRKVDFLESKGIKAIWFCRGDLLEKNMNHAVYAIEKGHLIGSHSYNHPDFSEISFEECKVQIDKTDDLIEEAYKKAGAKRPIKLFRFPFLNKGAGNDYDDLNWSDPHVKKLQEYLKKSDYRKPKFKGIKYEWWKKAGLDNNIDVDCTYDTYDWAVIEDDPPHGYKDLNAVLARMDENVPEGHRGINFQGSNEIIMMHDFGETKDMFIPMIEKLLSKSLHFELP